MTTSTIEHDIQTLNIVRETEIAASVEIVFESLLEEMGPGGLAYDGSPYPRTIEPWPGGRWFRDLGNNSGHLWGHVQVIKPPPHPKPLIEICGPLMMSYPAINFVQYRLTPSGRTTHLTLTHRAMGLILPEHREGMPKGWEHHVKRVAEIAARRRGT